MIDNYNLSKCVANENGTWPFKKLDMFKFPLLSTKPRLIANVSQMKFIK